MVDATAGETLVPPMAWDAWGDPALAKPLSAGIRSLLEQALGVSGTAVAGPGIDEVTVSPSRLSAAAIAVVLAL